ncbi:unnamed protein product [Vitrella brassicaformis CCMP3155]|uniref:Uncharacterized protein n=1 Tax=Vitrella brassicaformis (strain CCMP3155) TaxID=1169540 RepID=A0A0G4E8U1_VITBC|nr:unnamed protein product [Vitrella brassicaformis CCMP3155]|eukprot:CEL91617.1 unnamed protein product [Vitrella brassicaformis CCMP3155]
MPKRVRGVSIHWAYAPGEVAIKTSVDGREYEAALPMRTAPRTEESFDQDLLFDAPRRVKAMQVVMGRPVHDFYGINTLRLIGYGVPTVTLISGITSIGEEQCLQVEHGRVHTAGARVTLASCLEAAANAAFPSGYYYVQPPCADTPFRAFCHTPTAATLSLFTAGRRAGHSISDLIKTPADAHHSCEQVGMAPLKLRDASQLKVVLPYLNGSVGVFTSGAQAHFDRLAFTSAPCEAPSTTLVPPLPPQCSYFSMAAALGGGVPPTWHVTDGGGDRDTMAVTSDWQYKTNVAGAPKVLAQLSGVPQSVALVKRHVTCRDGRIRLHMFPQCSGDDAAVGVVLRYHTDSYYAVVLTPNALQVRKSIEGRVSVLASDRSGGFPSDSQWLKVEVAFEHSELRVDVYGPKHTKKATLQTGGLHELDVSNKRGRTHRDVHP